MVLYTRGYGRLTGKENARATFKNIFGSYYSLGAEVKEGLVFDFPKSELLLNEELRQTLEDYANTAGGLEYHASFHFNFS